jgi:hypothetical protein
MMSKGFGGGDPKGVPVIMVDPEESRGPSRVVARAVTWFKMWLVVSLCNRNRRILRSSSLIRGPSITHYSATIHHPSSTI